MKKMCRLILANLLFCLTLPAVADDAAELEINASLQTIAQYLTNLGGYLGYNITHPTKHSASEQLIDIAPLEVAESFLVVTALSSIPVNAFSNNLSQFFPSTGTPYSDWNNFANTTFGSYNSPANSNQISVNPLIDQSPYQGDPVSQSVLNILATPDYTVCTNNDNTQFISSCNSLYENKVMSNVIGNMPTPDKFYSYEYNQPFLAQLNGNTLIAPLLYSTQNTNTSSTSSSPNQSTSAENGLTAQNQAQTAANFVRYAMGGVAPITLPNRTTYSDLYSRATNSKLSAVEQSKAQSLLTNYLTSLRVYAAQASVGFSNLYYIFSKRMPQTPSGSASPPNSQAMSEFVMATWRLYKPGTQQTNQQWVEQINNASPATVQKEIVTLLAEINYQLYLNRQQEERVLLTQTMLLLQNSRSTQPSANLTAAQEN